MSQDPSSRPSESTRTGSISRRRFDRLIGATAAAGSLDPLSFGDFSAGFSENGLPVGLQIVGRHRDDWSVLQMAHAFEQATQHGNRRPEIVRI